MSEPMRGWWSVVAEDTERLTPEAVKLVKDGLDQALADGKQIVAIEGMTFTFHEFVTVPAPDPERLMRALVAVGAGYEFAYPEPENRKLAEAIVCAYIADGETA